VEYYGKRGDQQKTEKRKRERSTVYSNLESEKSQRTVGKKTSRSRKR